MMLLDLSWSSFVQKGILVEFASSTSGRIKEVPGLLLR